MKKKNKKDSFLTFSLYFLIGSISLFAVFIALRVSKNTKTTEVQTARDANTGEKIWMDYTNTQFGFSMDVPRLLTKRETRDRAGYRYFVIMGENELSKGKGISLGITDRSSDEEIEETKKGYKEAGELVQEKEITIAAGKGKLLSFKPKGDDKTLESRDVVIFSHDRFTFTMSTDPLQIGHMVESFKWN